MPSIRSRSINSRAARVLRRVLVLNCLAVAALVWLLPASASAGWQWVPSSYTGTAYARCATQCARVQGFLWYNNAWYSVSVATTAQLSVRPYSPGWHWADLPLAAGGTRTVAIRSSSLAANVPEYLRGTRLPIPARATVLTLSGLNFNLVNNNPRSFGGLFSRAPYTMSKINYPASTSPKSIPTGVANLDAALKRTAGPIIVLAHSQGAQVASRWMREHANDPAAPAASRVTFLLTGNPLRATGGYIIGRTEIGGTIGRPTPTFTKWPIVDVARQYDGWADWVKDERDLTAIAKANTGKLTYHLRYDVVDLWSPTNTVTVAGNTTFMITQEQAPL